LCYWIESEVTFVIAEIVATKYRVLISFDRYHLPLFCHACAPLPEGAILVSDKWYCHTHEHTI